MGCEKYRPDEMKKTPMAILSCRPALAAVLLAAGPLVSLSPACAGDQAPTSDQLPGVKGGYSIVKPEPDNPSTTTLDGLNLKLGNVQVKVMLQCQVGSKERSIVLQTEI